MSLPWRKKKSAVAPVTETWTAPKPTVHRTESNRVKLFHAAEEVVDRELRECGARRESMTQMLANVEERDEASSPSKHFDAAAAARLRVNEALGICELKPLDKYVDPRAPADSKDAVFEFAHEEVLQLEATTGVSLMSTETAATRAMFFEVFRIGNPNLVVQVDWATQNFTLGAAYYGDDGKDVGGTLRFDKGVTSQFISLDWADDPTWNMEGMFKVSISGVRQLCQGEGRVYVGPQGWSHGFKLNTEKFPLNVTAKGDGWDGFRFGGAFITECAWMMPWKTAQGFALQCVPAFTFVSGQLILAFILGVFEERDLKRSERRARFFKGAAMYLGNWCIEWLANARFVRLKLGGKAIRELRIWILTQMTQLTSVAAEDFDLGDIPTVMDTQVVAAVTQVFVRAFTMFASVIKIMAQFYLVVTAMDSRHLATSFGPLLAGLFVWYSVTIVATFRRQYLKSFQAMNLDDNLSAFATMIETCRQLVTNYGRGFAVSVMFEDLHKAASKSSFQAALFKQETADALHWGTVAAGVWVIFNMAVKAKSASDFVLVFNSVVGIGAALEQIMTNATASAIGLAAVKKIAEPLNAETRRKARFQVQQSTAKERADLCAKLGPKLADEVLVLSKAQIYDRKWGGNETAAAAAASSSSSSSSSSSEHKEGWDHVLDDHHLTPPMSLIIHPGQLLTLLDGPESCAGNVGKFSFFKILNGEIQLARGCLHIPKGFTTCLLPPWPLMFDGTLMFNLRISSNDTDEVNVWRLCADLGLSDALMFDPTSDVGANGQNLSLSDRAIIALARALLSNKDYIFIAQTLDLLSPPRVHNVIRTLNRYIIDRGFYPKDWPIPVCLRRKKTIFYITKSKGVAEAANVRICLNPNGHFVVADNMNFWNTDAYASETADQWREYARVVKAGRTDRRAELEATSPDENGGDDRLLPTSPVTSSPPEDHAAANNAAPKNLTPGKHQALAPLDATPPQKDDDDDDEPPAES